MRLYSVIFLSLFSTLSFSADVIKLEGISIQGNSEEPNVLYIIPWQEAPGEKSLFSPVKSYRNKWLKPTNRRSMEREVNYLNGFKKIEVSAEEQPTE